MAFTVQDFHDLVRLLEAHPEWRAELRRLILAEELLELPRRVEERFDRLEGALARLAEAQARTEERVGRVERALAELAEAQARTEGRVTRLEEAVERLAEAQAKTEERVGRLEEAVARLAEAQARTEERVTRLEEAVERLAEAQARTEASLQALAGRVDRLEERVTRLEAAVERLAEAQAKTEERVTRLEEAVARLAEAQARTEEQVEELARAVLRLEGAVGALRREVGTLANTIGATAEEEAGLAIEYVLRTRGFEILGTPRPVAADGFEVDLAFPVRDPAGRTFTILAEVKVRLAPGHIRDWARRARSEGFKEALSRAGLPGPYLVYVYGLRAMAGTEELAAAEGVGLVTPRGEQTPPVEVA